MRSFFMMLFMGLGYLLQFGGSLFLFGLFLYGIYALFAISLTTGFMMIGGAVVGGWIIQIVSSLLLATAMGIATIGAKDE